MTPDREASVYKTLSIALSSAFLTLCAAYYTAERNVVTHEEFPGLVQQYSTYTGDQKDIQSKLSTLYEQNGRLQSQVGQLQSDVARISDKVGVPAHPGGSR